MKRVVKENKQKIMSVLATKQAKRLMQIREGSNQLIEFNTKTFSSRVIDYEIIFPVGCAVLQTSVCLFISGGGKSKTQRR